MSNAKARITRDPADNLTPADACDLAESIAFPLRFEDRKRKHDDAEYMAAQSLLLDLKILALTLWRVLRAEGVQH